MLQDDKHAQRWIKLVGAPRAMGRQLGETDREAIRGFYDLREAAVLAAASKAHPPRNRAKVLAFCEQCLEPTRTFDAAGWEEMQGVAEATGLSMPQLILLNGFTDVIDAVKGAGGGCTAVGIPPNLSASGHALLAQTWDMRSGTEPFTRVVHRQPAAGAGLAETISLQGTGTLAMIAVSAAGMATAVNNLRMNDARPGVNYLSLIHRQLQCPDAETAAQLTRDAPILSGHAYWTADARDRIFCQEKSVRGVADFSAGGKIPMAHTNHCLDSRIARHETYDSHAASQSRARLARTLEILAARKEKWTAAAIFDLILRDRKNAGANPDLRPICRLGSDPGETSPTCGAAVMEPATGRMWVTATNPLGQPEVCVQLPVVINRASKSMPAAAQAG